MLQTVIVIVTFNSAADIERCVRSAAHHCAWLQPGTHEVHVVDNASTDDTRTILAQLAQEFAWLQIHLNDENLGFGNANNVVLRGIEARTYWLLNADAWLIADSIGPAHELILRNEDIGVVGLPLVFPDGSPQTAAFERSSAFRWFLFILGARRLANRMIRSPLFKSLMLRLPLTKTFARTHGVSPLPLAEAARPVRADDLRVRDASWVAGAALGISRPFRDASGGFDPAIFLYGEDEDLCLEAHRRGFRVTIVDGPPVVHKLGWNASKAFNFTVARLKYRSLKYFIGKNVQFFPERMAMYALLPFYVYGRHVFAALIRSRS
ncbi:glycosyltransferase [Erythrobacteraceae bacterium WH01K]|nr:glycosyltransferase [Erythrobacteraceae bacterium WH01K]